MLNLLGRAGAIVVCALLIGTDSRAATGDWDRSFGEEGRMVLAIAGITFSVRHWEPQADGKLVVAGHVTGSNGVETEEYLLARINAEGTPDTSFDGDGFMRFDLSSPFFGVIELELQADGKIVVAAQAGDGPTIGGHHARVLRFNPDGSPDSSFGTAGELVLRYSRIADNPRVKLGPNGAILVVSRLGDWLSNPTIVVTRVTPAGAVDGTFGTDGSVVIDSPEGDVDVNTFAVASDGAVIIGGEVGELNNTVPFIARVTNSGQRDASFGTNGIAPVPFLMGNGYLAAVAATPDGKVLIAAEREDRNDLTQHFIARFNPNGTPDPTFGSGGRIIVPANVESMLIEADGKIVLAGSRHNFNTDFGWLARYNADGSPDVTFGSRGERLVDLAVDAPIYGSPLQELRRHPDGGYGAIARIIEEVSFESTYVAVRFLSGGASPGAIGIRSTSEAPLIRLGEGNGTLSVFAYRTGGADGAISAQYRVVGETATAGEDFVASTGTITFNDGQTGNVRFQINLLDDNLRESVDERFYVELFAPTGGAGISKSRAQFEFAADQDMTSTVSFGSSIGPVLERGMVRGIVQRTGNLAAPLTLTYTPMSGTAIAGSDFIDASGIVSWAANEAGPRVIEVELFDDSTIESNEQFTIVLSVPAGHTVSDATAEIVIVDDDDSDAEASIGVSALPTFVQEPAGQASIVVHRLGDSTEAVSANWRTRVGSGTTDATADEDYTSSSGTLSWTAGDSSPKTIVVPLIDDSTYERVETIALDVFPVDPARYVTGLGSLALAYIIDDDGVPTQPTISIAETFTVAENEAGITIPVTLTGLPSNTVSARFSLRLETAGVADLTLHSGDVTWFAGETGTRTIYVPITNDMQDELDEMFTVTLSRVEGGATLGNSVARVTIADDDPTSAGQPPPAAPSIRVAPSSAIVSEGQQSVVLEVTRQGDLDVSLYGTFAAVADATASAPADFISFSGGVSWEAGDNATRVIEVHINGDTVSETPESFVVNVGYIVGSMTVGSTQATITIVDDDDASVEPAHVGFINAAESVAESASSVTLQVGRSGNTSIPTSVTYSAVADSAGASDFVASSGTLTWSSNDSSIKLITIALTPDSAEEPNETFTVTLQNASSGTHIDTASASVTIVDDDDGAIGAPVPPSGGGAGGSGSGGGGQDGLLALLIYAALFSMQLRSVSHRRGRCA